MTSKRLAYTAAALLLLAFAAPASASHWCGENGLIRFSFVPGPELQSVYQAEPDENGLTRVDLYVWLTDVAPMQRDGEAVLGVGGCELELQIDGGKPFVSGKEFPGDGMNVARENLGLIVGLNPDQKLEDGATLLATYHLLFQEKPENVRFSIKPEGIVSCPTIEGCPGSGTRALWIGPRDAKMLSEVFGAGCVPAWLNPTTDKPDQTPERGKSTWQDVGRFQPR